MQALVRCSEDVLHTLEETVPGGGGPGREPWVGELEALKDQLLSTVEPLHQTIGAQCDFHRCLSKVGSGSGRSLQLGSNTPATTGTVAFHLGDETKRI